MLFKAVQINVAHYPRQTMFAGAEWSDEANRTAAPGEAPAGWREGGRDAASSAPCSRWPVCGVAEGVTDIGCSVITGPEAGGHHTVLMRSFTNSDISRVHTFIE